MSNNGLEHTVHDGARGSFVGLNGHRSFVFRSVTGHLKQGLGRGVCKAPHIVSEVHLRIGICRDHILNL